MAAGATYVPIQTQTLGSSASSVTFSSIPQTYTDLVCVIQATASNNFQLAIKMGNGSIDTGNNYSSLTMNGDGSTTYTYYPVNAPYIQGYADYMQTSAGFMATVNFQNYTNTNIYKTVVMRGSNANTGTGATAGLWRSASAVNTILFLPTGGGTFLTNSTFTLFGISAA